MRVKVVYRKNLKMTPGKLAAQVAHAVKGLGVTDKDCDIIVLGVSDRQFLMAQQDNDCYVQKDKGLTEVEQGTETCLAFIENY